jgi:hypothetical protein
MLPTAGPERKADMHASKACFRVHCGLELTPNFDRVAASDPGRERQRQTSPETFSLAGGGRCRVSGRHPVLPYEAVKKTATPPELKYRRKAMKNQRSGEPANTTRRDEQASDSLFELDGSFLNQVAGGTGTVSDITISKSSDRSSQ